MIEIGDILGKAFEDFKNNAVPFIVATLIALIAYVILVVLSMVITFGVMIGVASITKNIAVIQITQLVVQLLTQIISIAVMQFLVLGGLTMSLKVVRGQKPEIGDMFSQIGKVIPATILGLIIQLVAFVGFLLCVVPGVIWQLMTSLAGVHLLDKDLGPIESIQASMQATTGYKLQLFLLFLVMSLLMFVSMIPCGLGMFVTIPMFGLAIARVYVILSEAAAKQAA